MDHPAPQREERARLFSTHEPITRGMGTKALGAVQDRIRASMPVARTPNGMAMDANNSGQSLKDGWSFAVPNISDVLAAWYASQGFIGYHMAAIIAQHWLIDKACTMPARDAVRHGFEITVEGGQDSDKDAVKKLEKANRKFRLRYHMREFVRQGRIFGIRICMFRVESTDPLYYEKPFNPDGVTPGSYKGLVQVDPYWCSPVLDGQSAADPAAPHFYEPTWWIINGRKYHRSHLVIFKTAEVPDLLKPTYGYGGVPVPQRIMERVYAAERTANEAPQLAMTKRTMVWNTNIADLLANQEEFASHMANFIDLRDNFGVKINDKDDEMTQFETSLADLDDVIMSQYQIVAAASHVPATKLLGTTPKGFNATGEYEDSSYHEELEAIQENDLTPLAERHMLLIIRSEIEPDMGLLPGTLEAVADWRPVDSPTAKEAAETAKTRAETDKIWADAGAIDGMDIRNRLRKDADSGYKGLADIDPNMGLPPGTDPLADPLAADPLAVTPGAAADPLAVTGGAV